MTKNMIASVLVAMSVLTAAAQGSCTERSSTTTVRPAAVPALNEGWYVQVGLDVTFQTPYGIGFSRTLPGGTTENVFGAGRTQGLVVAAGRWFTPGLGLRARANWENGFAPLRNADATWLNFLPTCETAQRQGGYASVVGDVQLDVQGLFWPYRPDRMWHLQVFPRAGLVYNFILQKGSPLIGAGVGNTFRLTPRTTLFFDVAYQKVSSGFNGRGTDIGTGANGYLDATLGVQLNLGRR